MSQSARQSASRPLLFAHGWGFDAGVWDAVVGLLPGRPVFRVEAGYLGGTPDWPDVPAGTLLVGHSAGVMALLQRRPAGCIGLVAINGFTRFLADDGFPGVADRVLARMERGLAQTPGAVLRAFRQRCGDPGELGQGGSGLSEPGSAEAVALAGGLQQLREADERVALSSAGIPVLALAARDDPIVLPGHSEACFGRVDLRWSETGGHLLPLARPDWCAAMIDGFVC